MSTLEAGAFGRQIKGPSAVGSDPRRFWHLTWALATTEWKLRFFGSALGYLWQLMRPLLMFSVLYVLFAKVAKFGGDGVQQYAVGLLLGLVLFTFLAEATTAGVGCIVERESLVRKIEFPRLAVPLSVVLTALFNLGLNLCVVMVFLIASGGEPRWTWLELPVIIVLLIMLATGLAMLLSVAFVRYRDVRPIWDVLMQIGFYATPIFYTIETVRSRASAKVAHLFMLNPFAALLQQARHAFVDPSHSSAAAAIGGGVRLLIPLALIFAVLVVGYLVFRRAAPRLAEEL